MTVRLLTGDCREVLAEMAAQSVDMVLADPPYGETSLEWDKRVDGWLDACLRVMKPSASLWCFGSMRFFMERADDFAGWKMAQDVVWQKHNGSGFDRDRFRRVHEHVVQFYPAKVKWRDIYRDPQFVPGDPRPNAGEVRRVGPAHRGKIADSAYRFTDKRLMTSVIPARSCHHHAIHPTQKPVDLLAALIRYSCPLSGTVLDPFAGSGSTLEAAALVGRDAIGVELKPEYAEMAEARLRGPAPSAQMELVP